MLTVYVVDLEEELDLVVRRLSGELVHGVDELLQRDAAVVILVEDVEHALHEERLKKMFFKEGPLYIYFCLFVQI